MKVSVIIPCFNGRQYLAECLRSVTQSAEPSQEILVVDDGSTENIREVVERFAPAVRYVWQSNAGPAAARNTGIRATSGEYIRLLDADDYLIPSGAATEQVRLLDAHPEVGLVYGQALKINEQGQPFGVTRPRFARASYVRSGDAELADLIVRNHIRTSSTVIRRRVVDRVGVFPTELRRTEDWDLWLRIAQVAAVAYIAKPVVAYRVRANSLTASNEAAVALEVHSAILERLFADPHFAARYGALEGVARADLYARMVRHAVFTGRRDLAWLYARMALGYGLPQRQWETAAWSLWLVAMSWIPESLYQPFRFVKRRSQVAIMLRQSRHRHTSSYKERHHG